MAEFKAHLKLEVEKEDRRYEFFMPIGSPLGECYDACFEVLQKITQAANDSVDKSKRPEEIKDGVEIVADDKKVEQGSKKK